MTHKHDGFREHRRTDVLGFSQGIADFGTRDDQDNDVACPGTPGTFLMHHAKTIHYAGANRSPDRSRRALGFIYYAKSAKLDTDARDAYQAALNSQLRAAKRI